MYFPQSSCPKHNRAAANIIYTQTSRDFIEAYTLFAYIDTQRLYCMIEHVKQNEKKMPKVYIETPIHGEKQFSIE